MGEAKRRKENNRAYGKFPETIPDDYKKHKGFEPCFGYVYMVENKTNEPCTFAVQASKLSSHLMIDDTYVVHFSCQNYTGTVGLVTIEGNNPKRFTDLTNLFTSKSANELRDISVTFTVKPRYDKKFLDQEKLKVIPFWEVDTQQNLTTKYNFLTMEEI